jgi:hypothetical protein
MIDGRLQLVIAGSRTVFPTIEMVDEAVRANFAHELGRDHDPRTYIAEVIDGGADGGDRSGREWANAHGIPVHPEPITDADWKLGKFVGPRMRNRRMADRGDAALIWWDGLSGGSSDMCTRMVARRKPVVVIPTLKRPKEPRRARP